MENKKSYLKSKNGISILEVILSLAVLAGATVVISKLVTASNQVAQTSKAMTDATSGVGMGVTHFRNVLIGSRSQVDGICSMLILPANATSGVHAVMMNPNIGSVAWNTLPADLYSPHEDSAADCPSHASPSAKWKRCYKVNAQTAGAEATQDSIVTFEARIVSLAPGVLNEEEELADNFLKDLAPEDLGSPQDAKSLGFRLLVSTVTNNKKVESFGFVSSLDAAPCNLNGTLVEMVATGPGDVLGTKVYNRPELDPDQIAPLSITYEKSQAQFGAIDDNISAISTDDSRNIESSCAESKFSCKGATNRKFDGQLNFLNLRIKYNSPNSLTQDSSINVQPSLEGFRDSSNVLWNGAASPSDVYLLLDGVLFSYVGSPSDEQAPGFYTVALDDATPPTPLKGADGEPIHIPMRLNSSHNLRVLFKDSRSANKVCSNVCNAGNLANSRVEPRVSFNLLGLGSRSSESSSSITGCTTCFMKNCSRLGLDTFGPYASMPDEAYDSSVPECSVANSGSSLGLTPEAFRSPAALAPDMCVAATIQSNSELKLETRPCNTALPVMCFNFGRYFLAENKFSGSAATLDFVTFDNANDRCANTGRNVVPVDKFVALFNQFAMTMPILEDLPKKSGDSSFYDFLDYGKQGIFLAPHSSSQEINAISFVKTKTQYASVVNGTQAFWVNLKTGSNNRVYAPPVLANKPGRKGYVHYFSKQVSPELHEFRAMSAADELNTTADAKGVLMNHPKVRGLIPVNEQVNGTKKMKFICRQKTFPHEVFISNGDSHKFSDGDNRCNLQNGIFAAPTSPWGWARSLILAEQNSEDLPFPEPLDSNGDPVSPNITKYGVWVAMEKVSGDWKPSLSPNFPPTPLPHPSGNSVLPVASHKVCFENLTNNDIKLRRVPLSNGCTPVTKNMITGSPILEAQWMSMDQTGVNTDPSIIAAEAPSSPPGP